MKIDAHGAMGEAGTRGDLRTGHAFDEAEDESLSIAFGKGKDGVESRVGFGVGVRGGRSGGSRRVGIEGGGYVDKFAGGFAAAVKVRGAIAGDGGEPGGKFGDFPQRGKPGQSLEEDVMDEIIDIGVRYAAEKDAVDHAGVAGIEDAEGGTVALLSGADEGMVKGMIGGMVGAVMLGGSIHDREPGAGRMEFKECRHVMTADPNGLFQ